MFTQPAAPSSGDSLNWASLNGALLLVEPTGVQQNIQTVHGLTDAVAATVSVLDGPLKGTVYGSALVFPKVLQSQLSAQLGQMVLGRLGQGAAQPGKSAPWQLQGSTPADQQVGAAFVQARQSGQFAQPQQAQPQQQPQPQPQQQVQQQVPGDVPF